MRIGCASVVAAVIGAGVWAQAPPTFRAGTREVLVDAAVVDKKGNFQRDLKAEDFKILEDGKEQKITSFSLESAGVAGRKKPSFVALVFESEETGFRETAAEFVEKFASPDLYLAVISNVKGSMRVQQAFTTDGERIKNALKKMPAPPAPSDKSSRPHEIMGRISSVASTLARVRGRKALFLFSYGMFGSRQPGAPAGNMAAQIRQAVSDCNAADVSVYSFQHSQRRVDIGGDYYEKPRYREDDHGGAVDMIRDVAENTGGKYTPPGVIDVAAYMGKIAREQNEYYLLGFTPQDDSADQPCHKLKVKVERSGVKVDARDTYCATGQYTARGLKPAQKALEARLGSGAAGTIAAGMQVSWFYAKRNEAVVDVAMDIDAAVIKHGKTHGEFNALAVVYREDGSVAARIPDTVGFDFDTQADMSNLLKGPYHYSRQFDLTPGRYRVQLAVGPGDPAQTFGKAEAELEIEPWNGPVSVSGIALGEDDFELRDVTAELDNSLLEGPRRMLSKGREMVPMGGTQFPAGKDGLFYFEIYGATAPEVRARIVERATGQVKNDSGAMDASGWARAGSAVIPITLNLPVSRLDAGAYTLEVRVGEVLRKRDFEVK